MTAFTVLADQVSAAEKTEVLGDRRTRNGKGAGDLSGRLAATAEKIENRAAGGIGEGLKCGFVTSRWMCNRTVTHNA